MRIPSFFGLLLLLSATGAVASEDDLEPLLLAPGGPYRGTVVDSTTGLPLPEAAVVLLWQRGDDQVKGLKHLAESRETFTDGAGQFVFNVTSIERRLVKRSFAPRIVIFKARYTPFPPERVLFPPGALASRFASAGSKVELTPALDYEDQVKAFNAFFSALNAAHISQDDIPETWHALREESDRLWSLVPRPPGQGGKK